MSGWPDQLPEEERERWEAFVDHFRRDALEKIAGSAVFASIAPASGEFDVQVACELGAGILLDKPLLLIVPEGRDVSPKLERIADEIVRVDVDTQEGQAAIAAALKRLIEVPSG